jgi:uncharacterized protein YjbJ (UPF0337 family)
MAMDRMKGKAKDLQGKAQRKVGEMTDDRSQQLKGMGKQAEGKTQEAFGKMKGAGRKAMDEVREEGQKAGENIRGEKRRQSSVQPQRNIQSPGTDVYPERDEDIGEEVA